MVVPTGCESNEVHRYNFSARSYKNFAHVNPVPQFCTGKTEYDNSAGAKSGQVENNFHLFQSTLSWSKNTHLSGWILSLPLR